MKTRLPLIMLAALACAPALAAGGDCPPLGHMPTYVASDAAQMRNRDSTDLRVTKPDGDTEYVPVAGRTCTQIYTPKEGTNPSSDFEIQSNYRDVIKKLGGKSLFEDDRNTVAMTSNGGQETWFWIYSQETEIDVKVIVKDPFKSTLLPPSGKDYRLFGHLPNYDTGEVTKRNYDQFVFWVQDGDERKEVKVQGAKYAVIYVQKQGVQPASDFDIQSNYRAAVTALGGKILFADGRNTTARFLDNGQTIWLHVYSQENEIDLTVIEEKAFQASLQAPTVDKLKAALEKDGRVALYINFDFGKAALRPDAAPVIAEIVKLMQGSPALKLEIGGHTDDVGGHDYNVKLSQARAAAVAAALAAQGIPPSRLQSAGYGPDKPLADNNSEEGRAKNRRVELVKL